MAELEGELEEKEVQLRIPLYLAVENATLPSKVKRNRAETIQLQLESVALFVVMDEVWARRDKTEHVVLEVTNLKNWEHEQERSCARVAHKKQLQRCAGKL